MDALKNDYHIIKSEIERYFEFTKHSQSEKTNISSDSGAVLFVIDDSTKKILKASSFLLLYNLIEATVRKCIVSIYDSIHVEKLDYKGLSDEIQKVWLKSHEKMLRDCESKNFAQKLQDKVQICVLNEPLKFYEGFVQKIISGNLNSESIKSLCFEYGIDVLQECKRLDDVKDKRNKLAHGELSFTDVGRDYTFKELSNIKDDVIKHLDMVVKKIEEFITQKKYKSQQNRKSKNKKSKKDSKKSRKIKSIRKSRH